MSSVLRGGRLTSVRKDVIKFTSSIKSDRRLVKPVIKINEAHVAMMMEQEIIEWNDGAKLLQALGELQPKMKLPSSPLEDVHVAVEAQVIGNVGPEVGGNLHIAKSRNDQVSTAIRMELRENLVGLMLSMIKLQEALTKLAEKHVETIIPGYTHLQPAQPVTFAHYLLSQVDTLNRALQRLDETYKRVNLCPMGAGALATSSFPINRDRVAELLGFDEIVENSIDAVGSRDFILETMANLTLIAVDISRLAEDFIIWSSLNFGLIELPDSFSSTSSIMPQKKNPDALEVIRARMSHAIGNFVTSATTVKALPSSYNLDFQEITPRLWESLKNVTASLDMFSKLIANLKVIESASSVSFLSFSASTELANVLVRKYKVPFRTAHKVVGSLVKTLVERKLALSDVTPELLRQAAQDSSGLSLDLNAKDILDSIDPLKFIESHRVRGGPSSIEVKRMLKGRTECMTLTKSNVSSKKLELKRAEAKLRSIVQFYSSSNRSSSEKLKNLNG
jgi:argininosuccinate lyase